jgi:predicted naringenin-chalcone synthase
VSSRIPLPGRGFRIDALDSTVTPDSEGDMAWTIGDKGFDMVLSTYVPKILEANVAEIVDGVLSDGGRTRSDVDRWAIHPGGRAILDKIQSGLELNNGALDTSREVLRQFGNMSSATILFVLDKIRSAPGSTPGEVVFAMAFGPGLTVETAVLTLV